MERIGFKPPAWYLLQCKPRQDERAELNLHQQNYLTFRPQFTTERLVRGKPQATLESLFPGYLFIQLSHDDNWAPLRSTRGVSRIVDFSRGPATVPDEVIDRLRTRCLLPKQVQAFKPGDALQIIDGPLSSLEGVFLSMDGEERVMILLQLLSRKQPVGVPVRHVEALVSAQAC